MSVQVGRHMNSVQKNLVKRGAIIGFQIFLSVQCNTLHGTEYKITCGACLCLGS